MPESTSRARRADLCAVAALGYPVGLYVLQLLGSLLLAGLRLADPEPLILVLNSLIAAAVPLLLVIWMVQMAGLTGRDLLLGPARPGALGRWLPLFLGAAMAANVAGSLLSGWLRAPVYRPELPAGGLRLVLYLLPLCVVAPLAEELFFRGLLQGLLRPLGPHTAVLGSALLFSLLHGSLSQWVVAFVTGLVLGACAEDSHSIKPGILLHMANNCLAAATAWLAQYGGSGALSTALIVLMPAWGLWRWLSQRPAPLLRDQEGRRLLLHRPSWWLALAALAVLALGRSAALQ